MMNSKQHKAIIGGAGIQSNFSLELAKKLKIQGYGVHVIARQNKTIEHLRLSLSDPDIALHVCDLDCVQSIEALIDDILKEPNADIAVYVHNAAQLNIGGFLEHTPEVFFNSWKANVGSTLAMLGILLPHMIQNAQGTVIFTGATASIRGSARFAPFASAKFALRGLAQSLAREFGPQGVHIAHVIVDGIIWGQRAKDNFSATEDTCIAADALAQLYIDIIKQQPSCWTHEIDLRPAKEDF